MMFTCVHRRLSNVASGAGAPSLLNLGSKCVFALFGHTTLLFLNILGGWLEKWLNLAV